MNYRFILSFVCLLLVQNAFSQSLDVLGYHLQLEPDITQGFVRGYETIRLATIGQKEISLACGSLEVLEVQGKTVKSFQQQGSQLLISFSKKKDIEIEIIYEGRPKRGMFFDPQAMQIHTVFATSQWMVCNMKPSDRATFELVITLPDSLGLVASGALVDRKSEHGSTLHHWMLSSPSPSYTFGLAAGPFMQANEEVSDVTLNYYSIYYDEEQLKLIFQHTPDMVIFFEEKSGISFFESAYNQVLIGNNYQEMAGFSTLKMSYGEMILNDSTVNLITHELAHQWWGNMSTCLDWTHFWLNEGFATYMATAFNGEQFGQALYDKDIRTYRKIYEGIKEKGIDRSLVFENWDSPTAEDRQLVYYKGAYVLHLLREELGDDVFWKAIQDYSKKYWGKSVVTADFTEAVEQSSGRDLSVFFNRWIYNIE